jgi:translation initiation factor IF-2
MTKEKEKKSQVSVVIRPPVVTLVGHIDHGKTTLLDKIRRSRIASKEAGGITQHIGAYKIKVESEGKSKEITFIDTPGHAAFSKMRARGVEVTDLVVLVVAADEGVKEQTQESYQHIKSAEVPFIVAINKIDLPEANIEKVKSQLSEMGIVPEDYGGNIVVVPVSAQTGEGIDNLLEMILLVAEMEELTADQQGELKGVVIESRLDRQCGCLATILVKNGKLKKGDQIFAEKIPAKVKALINWQGEPIKEALPGDPVEVLGFKEVPPIGSAVGEKPQEKKETEASDKKEEGTFKIILKADVGGSIEAIKANLPAAVEIVHSGVGVVTEGDVFLAQSTNADIFSFNVKLMEAAKKLAKQSQVKIFQTKIIYELLEEIEKRLKEEEDPLENKTILGQAEILAEFKIGDKRIAGGKVTADEIFREQKVFLKRNDRVIGKSVLVSLRHGKEDIKKAKKDQEFGAVFSPPLDFKKGDVIISYKDEEPDESQKG